MHYYTTLFDSNYLSRGLLMYESLKSCTKDFHLYVFAFDELTFRIITGMKLDKVTAIPLQDFETPELKRVKKDRSTAEYCWTCTPSVISYIIEKYKVPECTYVDSDLYFYSDPSVLISELDLSGKNVLITEHRYSFVAGLYAKKKSGKFCVQFMTFRNEESSLKVLERWRLQCIEWCFEKYEDGKFGDQKYLDEWPELYPNVHVMQNPGGGIAPWNIGNYSFHGLGIADRKTRKQVEPVFYHFQYVRSLGNGYYDAGWYFIPPIVKKFFYMPYIAFVEITEQKLQRINPKYRRNFTDLRVYITGSLIKALLKITFRYNIIKLSPNGILA